MIWVFIALDKDSTIVDHNFCIEQKNMRKELFTNMYYNSDYYHIIFKLDHIDNHIISHKIFANFYTRFYSYQPDGK